MSELTLMSTTNHNIYAGHLFTNIITLTLTSDMGVMGVTIETDPSLTNRRGRYDLTKIDEDASIIMRSISTVMALLGL